MLQQLHLLRWRLEKASEAADFLEIKYSIETKKFASADWHQWLNVLSTLKAIKPHLDELIKELKTPEQKNKLPVAGPQ
jgi:hypothetical protein